MVPFSQRVRSVAFASPTSNGQSAVLLPWLLVGAAMLILYLPTFWQLWNGLWQQEDHMHGPIVLGVVLWLLYQKWPTVKQDDEYGRPLLAFPVLFFGCMMYVVGRSQAVMIMELGSLPIVLSGAVLLMRGPAALRSIAFPVIFIFFMLPLPGVLVSFVTQPMKIAVSSVVEFVLHHLGYSVARTGVVLQIAQYRLLVADACAGLHTMFALEAMGLLYLNLIRHESLLRNVVLALLVIPISFVANVLRVMILTLVTYYFGDAVGQGFLHGFAGIVLFGTALMLLVFADVLLSVFIRRRAHACSNS